MAWLCRFGFHRWEVFRPTFFNWPAQVINLRRECRKCPECQVKICGRWFSTEPLEPNSPFRRP